MSIRIHKRDRDSSKSHTRSNSEIDDLTSLFAVSTINPRKKKKDKDIDNLTSLFAVSTINPRKKKKDKDVDDLTKLFQNTTLKKRDRSNSNSLEDITNLFNKTRFIPKKKKKDEISILNEWQNNVVLPSTRTRKKVVRYTDASENKRQKELQQKQQKKQIQPKQQKQNVTIRSRKKASVHKNVTFIDNNKSKSENSLDSLMKRISRLKLSD